MDYQSLLLQNKMIQPASSVLSSWKENRQDPNSQISQTIYDEKLAENPNIFKPGSENIFHMNSLDKAMRGNVDVDTALKEKINLEKNSMLHVVLSESDLIENMSSGAPIAPVNQVSYTSKSNQSKRKKKKLTDIIENAYRRKR